jgi:DNA-binding SARP family transcriptional activator
MESYGRLLGAPRVRVAETWHNLPLTKASALLVYLAYAGGWLSRDELLYVFYPDTPEAPARGSFRQLLSAVRKLPYSEGLETEETRLRWHLDTDVSQFKQAVSDEKWAKALELYGGEFLHDFQPHDLSEFDNWLSLERQALHVMWRKASLQFANELSATERYPLAAEVLATLYKADALDEEVLRAYLESLYSSGQKSQALDIFTTFKNTLHHELSSEPEASTLELIGLIQGDQPLSKRGSVAVKTRVQETKPQHNLPLQPTEFVGRELEKTKLTELLADPRCRLLTIVAPGGMGKTRLALEVARGQLETFAGVYFVSFAAVVSPDLMVYTLADALELSLFGSKPPKEQVLGYLKNKNMLLVLDNLEHLLAGVNFLSEILSTSAEIKILATSRERLQLQAEHVFDLEGLAVPHEKSSDAKAFDSLQLFAERAKHTRLDFALEQHLQAVTRICQLVGGMPLAIELAASWSRLLSPEEIKRELEQNLDILATSTRDLPQRHHSMRSVFEVSWQRLSEDEQAALRKLSVFQGGFTREAARAIAELDLPILLSLVNKSFLWRDSTGRFSQHPLILQYLHRKANDYPEEKNQIEEKHGLYYLELVKELAPDLRTQKRKQADDVLEKELPNIRAAWDWALSGPHVGEIRNYARALSGVFGNRHRHEGSEIFKRAVAALDENNPGHHAALGYALVEQASHEVDLGSLTNQAITDLIERALALLEPLGEYKETLRGLTDLGGMTRARGDLAKAREIWTAALSLARSYGSPQEIGSLLNGLSLVARDLGDFSEVSTLMRNNLEELRELGDLPKLCGGIVLLGAYLVYNDELDEGEKLLREGLELGRKYKVYTGYALCDLARLAYKRRDFAGAETLLREAYEAASKDGDEFMRATDLAILGRVKLAQGQVAEAEHHLVESLRVGWAANALLAVSNTLAFLAELDITRNSVKRGVTLLSFLSDYPAMEKRDRDEAHRILEKAKEHLSARAFTEAQQESKSLTLEGIVTGILEQGVG